jgi:3-oxoadipate enol-lactonase
VAHADGLYYERHGAGDPLLLITGWTISSAVFEPVLDLYSQHFECILYDHRGSARSKGSSPLTMAALAGDAARLLTALRIPRALVYGLSMGGMVALEVALRHADRVRGLVLGGTSPGGPLAPRLGAKEVLSMARGGIAERSLRAPLLFSSQFRREHPERVSELVAYFKRHRSSAATIAIQTLAAAQFATTLQLGRVRAPTLVMHGERDELVPLAAGRLLAARIPNAELAVVPGAGHAYALEAPQESLDQLLGWYERKLSRPRPREEAHVAPDR